MPHKKHFYIALQEAERGALYNNANSPKPSPGFKDLFASLFIST